MSFHHVAVRCATAAILCPSVSRATVLSPVHPSFSSFCMKSLSFLPIVVLLSLLLSASAILKQTTTQRLQRHLSAGVRSNPASIEHVCSSVLVFISPSPEARSFRLSRFRRTKRNSGQTFRSEQTEGTYREFRSDLDLRSIVDVSWIWIPPEVHRRATESQKLRHCQILDCASRSSVNFSRISSSVGARSVRYILDLINSFAKNKSRRSARYFGLIQN